MTTRYQTARQTEFLNLHPRGFQALAVRWIKFAAHGGELDYIAACKLA
jgi:hypothetical protein